jgi:hypothetical protein
MTNFYQKTLFTRWAADNRRLFSHEPYIDKEADGYFTVRFKGITRHITCLFSKNGGIMVQIHYRNQFFDIVSDFDLSEEKTADGRFLCRMCRDHPSKINSPKILKYRTREKLWIKHSFEPLAEYTRETFTDDAVLCLSRFGVGSTSAVIVSGKSLVKLRKREDVFREIPVVDKKA